MFTRVLHTELLLHYKESSVWHLCPYPELLKVLHAGARGHNNRGTGTTFLYLPGTSVSSVRPCHNSRNFYEVCNTCIPVPEPSGSYLRLPYPYPETTNPTQHSLANFHSLTKKNGHVLGNFTAVNYRGKTTVGGNCRDSVDYRGFR